MTSDPDDWTVRLSRWRSGWAWDLCSGGAALAYRTGPNGHGLYARRPDPQGKTWTWTCLDPAARWPTDRTAMRRAVLAHYGL